MRDGQHWANIVLEKHFPSTSLITMIYCNNLDKEEVYDFNTHL